MRSAVHKQNPKKEKRISGESKKFFVTRGRRSHTKTLNSNQRGAR